ncbi:MAG: signal peptide peptidase SppA [Candidatus Micrarchaeota archaeon]
MDNPSNRKKLILGTIALLGIAFVAVIIAFILLSQLLPTMGGKCVAEVDISYPLSVDGTPETLFDSGYPGSEELTTKINELNKRDDVGAVVFVFNSGGGSTVASREIYESVKQLKKPKVSYFREAAASGAYYVATGTDYIISDPYAVTGSIGVLTESVNLAGLFDKLGINMSYVTSGPHKDMGSPFRNATVEEQQIIQGVVDEIYKDFRSKVAENRKGKLNVAKFDEATDGRIMTGKQAVSYGLVDATGNKQDAFLKAAQLGGMDAVTAEDVRICKIDVRSTSSGLFGMAGLIHSFEERFPAVGIYFK